MNKSSARGHQNGMSVERQLAGLRAIERRNVAVEVAIRAGCGCALAWALTGSAVAVAIAGLILGMLAARRQRIPSLDELAERIDRARGTRGLVRTALAAQGGQANGSPLLVAHAVAQADALLRADGRAMVRPFRLPGTALAATAVVCVFAAAPSALAPSGVVEQRPRFEATDARQGDASSLAPEEKSERAVNRRPGTTLGDFARSVASSGRSASGTNGTVAEVTPSAAASKPDAVETKPEDPNPCPPEFLCVPFGGGSDRPPPSSGGGSNGRAPNGEDGPRRISGNGEPAPANGSDETDPGDTRKDAARGSTERNESDGVSGDGTNGPVVGDGTSAEGDGTPQKGSTVQPPKKQEGADPTERNGGLDGAGGTDGGLGEASARNDVKIAEEHVKGLWQASAEGAIDQIEEGLAGEQTSVPWRDLHAWYEAIAEDAVAKEGVPVTRRSYVQHYFETLAPQGEPE